MGPSRRTDERWFLGRHMQVQRLASKWQPLRHLGRVRAEAMDGIVSRVNRPTSPMPKATNSTDPMDRDDAFDRSPPLDRNPHMGSAAPIDHFDFDQNRSLFSTPSSLTMSLQIISSWSTPPFVQGQHRNRSVVLETTRGTHRFNPSQCCSRKARPTGKTHPDTKSIRSIPPSARENTGSRGYLRRLFRRSMSSARTETRESSSIW